MQMVLLMCPTFVTTNNTNIGVEVVWKCTLYLEENFLIILKLVLGEGIRLYLKESFLIILKLLLGEAIRQESGNFLYRHLMLSEVKI